MQAMSWEWDNHQKNCFIRELSRVGKQIERPIKIWSVEEMYTSTQRLWEPWKSKYNLWVECEEHKRFVKYLNEKHLKNEEFKGQPQDVVKLHEEIRTLKSSLAKFVSGIENLDKLFKI